VYEETEETNEVEEDEVMEDQEQEQEQEESTQEPELITYEDDFCNYSIDIPEDYNVTTDSNMAAQILTAERSRVCSSDAYCFGDRIEIQCLRNQGGGSIQERADQRNDRFNQTGLRMIGGQSAIVSVPRDTEGYMTMFTFGVERLFTHISGNIPTEIIEIEVSSGMNQAVRDQILDSFTFTN